MMYIRHLSLDISHQILLERKEYMETSTIVTIIVAILGSGGLSALITSLVNAKVSAKKGSADADKAEQEAIGLHVKNEITSVDYISQQLQTITENARKESDILRARNDELNNRINELNNKLQVVMTWIITDNQQYRQWLETELIKLKPDIIFPKCPPPPSVFSTDFSND